MVLAGWKKSFLDAYAVIKLSDFGWFDFNSVKLLRFFDISPRSWSSHYSKYEFLP
jgi:hypothetical protein